MARKLVRRRPEVESLETMVLLSGITASEPLSGGAVVLSGIAKGTYKTAKVGEPTTFSEKGTISPLGKVTIKGSIDYLEVHPSGTVTLSSASKKHGTITASLTTAGPFSPVFYTITSATGIFAGDTGSGESVLMTTPAKGRGPAHGKVTLTFVAPVD